jgi:ankyrin repeat protein
MPEGDTALMLAARSGNAVAVELLLDAGAAIDARDSWHGETALMWAAGENHAAVVRLLLERGADANAVSTEFQWDFVKQTGVASALPRGGLTALLHAAREDSLESAELLLEHGADPNAADPRGLSALRVAITNNNLDLAKLLLERGAAADDGALVEVVKLRTHPWVRAAKERRDGVTQLALMEDLLARGADIHFVPKTGMVKQHWVDGDHPNEPPLYLAAQAADLELMKLLAARGATAARSVSQKGASILMAATGLTPHTGAGATPIERPAELGLAAGRLALELGADVRAARKDGMTALHLAAENGWNEIAQFLIDEGALLDVRDWSGRLPIDVAKGVAAIPMPGDPPMPPRPPPVHDDTAALLRAAMATAGVAESPYVAPRRER